MAVFGVLTILAVLLAIISKRFSPLLALLLFPVLASLGAGFGWKTGTFMVAGIKDIAPVIGTFVFAILFFGIVTDAGLLRPLVSWLLRRMGSRPAWIVPCSALLALLVHLDGSGAVVFLVTIPALLPLYDRLGMDRRLLACSTSLAAGVNFLPWTGPTLRASAALHISPIALFKPLLVVQLVGLVFVFLICWWLGRREEKRLKTISYALAVKNEDITYEGLPPKFWWNALLALMVLGLAINGHVEPAIAFMLGTALALLLNYPSLLQQHERIAAHAPAALLMCSILFAAGAFSGILKGTGMLAALAAATSHHVSPPILRHLPVILGVLSMPLSLVFDPDSFYFGILPVLATLAASVGIAPIQVGQAALLGQMTTGFPVSPLTPATFLVVGLCNISLAEHQRFTMPFLFLASILMTTVAVLLRVIQF